jgi:hypothetical protein
MGLAVQWPLYQNMYCVPTCKITSYHILCTYYACKNFNVHPCHLVAPHRSGLCSVSPPCVLYTVVSMPNMRVRRCLWPEGNGVSSGEGGEGGPGPPNKEGDKQSTPSKEGGNMEQEEKGRTGQAWWRGPSVHSVNVFKKAFNNVIRCNIDDVKINVVFVLGE